MPDIIANSIRQTFDLEMVLQDLIWERGGWGSEATISSTPEQVSLEISIF